MQVMEIEKTKFIAEVQGVINSWIQTKPETRNVAHLSRETGVTDSSIRRLMNNGTKISDDSIYKLLGHVAQTFEFDTFLNSFSRAPQIQKWFERNYSYLKKSPSLSIYKPSPLAEEMTLNPIAFAVFSSILALKKVPVSYIKDQFGMRGEIELEKIMQKGLLFQQGDSVCIKEDIFLKITSEQTVALLPELTKTFFKPDHQYNARALEIGAVSKEGYIKIMDIYGKFLEEISSIYINHSGEIPVVVAGFFDSLTTQPYFEGGKNETPH